MTVKNLMFRRYENTIIGAWPYTSLLWPIQTFQWSAAGDRHVGTPFKGIVAMKMGMGTVQLKVFYVKEEILKLKEISNSYRKKSQFSNEILDFKIYHK